MFTTLAVCWIGSTASLSGARTFRESPERTGIRRVRYYRCQRRTESAPVRM